MGSLFLLASSSTPAHAATGINKTINFQGRLYNAQGATVPDGFYNVQFKIYQDGDGQTAGNSTGSPAGTLKWTEDHLNVSTQGVQVKNGFMSVELGSVTAFGTNIDWNQDTLWLSLNIGSTNGSCTPFTSCSGDGEMLPMKRFSSVPYALNTSQLGGLTSAQFVQLAQGVQTDASTNTTSIFLNKTGGGNFLQLQSSTVDVFTVSNSGDIAFGANADHTISVATAAAATAGKLLTISAGTGGSGAGSTGGDLVLQGGAAGGTDGNGGDVTINAGAKTGTGTDGTVAIGTSNTSAIALGQDTTLAAGKSLTVTGGNTASRPASPAEGMIYYDTSTKQLLTYENGKWKADGSDAVLVAANDSSDADKAAADYIADGTADESEINSALTSASSGGTRKTGKVYLFAGTYSAASTILIPNNTTLSGAGRGTLVQLNVGSSSDNLIENSDQTTNSPGGTGIVLQDLRLDGSLGTGGNQYGIYLNNMGGGTGASARQGAKISHIWVNNFNSRGISILGSNNNTISDNIIQANSGYGMALGTGSDQNNITNNLIQGGGAYAVNVNSAVYNTFSGNTIVSNTGGGFLVQSNSNHNILSNNIFRDNGGSSSNDSINLSNSDSNSIIGNHIVDTAGTGYAINISDSSSDTNYLADNYFSGTGASSMSDSGTGTTYGGQTNSSGTFAIQNAGGIALASLGGTSSNNVTISTGNASAGNSGSISLDVGTASGTKGTITIGGTNATSITLGNGSSTTTIQGNTGVTLSATTGTTQVCRNGSGYLSTCDATYLAPTATNFIQNGTSQQASSNFNISGTGTADILQGTTKVLTALLDASSAGALDIGTTTATQINLNKNVQVAANQNVTFAAGTGNFDQSASSGTFKTGTGAVSLNGDTTVAAGKSLTITGGNTASRPASPTAGMLYYDTSTSQLLTYNGGKWKADGSDAVLVAANDSSDADKAAADYIADGTADESEINTALTAASSSGARKTGKVFLFAGTYNTTTAISIPNNVTLAGAGRGSLVKFANITGTSVNMITNTDTAGTADTGIIIQDLQLDGNKSVNLTGTQNGIYLNKSGNGSGASAKQGSKLLNLYIANFRTNNIHITNSSANNTVSNVTSVNAVGAGFYLGGTGASNNNNTFTNNLAQGNGTNGFTLDGASYNNMTNNTAEGNTGIGLSLTSTSGSNNVTGNTARNNTSYGISVGSSTSNNLSSNTSASNGGSGIYVGASSYYTSVTANNTSGNTGSGIMVDSSGRSTISGNTSYSNTVNGVNVNNSSQTNVNSNTIYSNPTGVYVSGTTSDDGNISGNNISNSSSYGIQALNMDRASISNNRIVDSGGASNNNAIYFSAATSNTVTGNVISDSAATTNYAINIFNSSSTGNYLADNQLGSGATINDAAPTSTIYGGQSTTSGTFTIQNTAAVQIGTAASTATSNVTIGTGNASAGASGNISLDVGTATTTAGTISLGTANTSAITIGRSGITTTIQGNVGVTLNGTTGTTMVCQNGTSLLSSCDASYLAPTATNFIQNQNTAAQTTSNFWVSGTGKVDTAVLTPRLDTNTATSLAIGDTNATSITLGKSAGTAAVNVSSSTVNLGIATTATTMQAVGQTSANTQGSSLTMQGATGNGSGAGGNVTIQGGTGGATNANGGNLYLSGGTAGGASTSTGLVIINTPTFSTTANDANCYTGGALVAIDCTIAATSVNGSGAIIVGFSATGKTASLPDPTISTAGRVVYITAANGSSEFTLSVNGGGTGNTIAMRQNTTATMIWNGNDWTAAGASSSTTLQSAYDNTLQSAGGAELVVSSTSNTNGLTIRNSTTSPVTGTLLSVQTASAAGLFQVNGNVTEYATNAGSEIGGGAGGLADNTYPANTWTALTGTTISRYTTAGDYIATGQGSVSALTTAVANTGVSNRLSTTLNANMTYNVSFTTRLTSGTFTDMNVYYSRDGTTTGGATCAATATSVTSVWTKVNCTFTAPSSGITSSNAIFIRQTTGVVRTFYVDNLSVTLAADLNYATDGTVNDDTNFATNWTQVGTSTITRNTSDGQEASDSAQAAAGTTANNGVDNKLSVFPLTGTLYRVSVYAKLVSGTAFTDFKVRYTPDNGSNFVDCVDYNTQTVTTTDWTQVTCYIKTIGTAVSSPYIQFIQPTAPGSARTFLIDTFSMTLTSASTPNVQIGGGSNGGPTTLFTLDRGASAPIAANNDALLGSMYYDTSLGKLQCYEADGWGACGSSPDNIITISPEFNNAVLHGTGIGTLTSDLCSDTLNINDGSSSQPTICGSNETYNFYKWTSPQASAQTYSIYVTYQLPTTFKDFNSGQTSLMGRTDSTNSTVAYQVYRNSSSGLSACGSSVQVSTGVSSTWTTQTATGSADPSTCGFVGGDSIVFKIDVTARSNANAYVGNLNFAFSNR